MITLSLESLKKTSQSRPPGYLDDVLSRARVDGDRVLLEADDYRALIEKYRATPGPVSRPEPKATLPPVAAAHTSGPGTELKKLLSMIGITAKPNCSCNARAKTMDVNGVEWCRQNIDQISQWLREEAARRRLPYSDIAGKSLISLAIRRAEKAQRGMPAEAITGT